MSKAGDGQARFGYSIHIADAMNQPKGFSYEGVLWVDQHSPDGVERIWERPAEQGSA